MSHVIQVKVNATQNFILGDRFIRNVVGDICRYCETMRQVTVNTSSEATMQI